MNKIKFLSLSLVALLMACFTACENKYEAEHPAELVGTWTCLTNGYVEALVIKADGSVLSTGYDGEDYWENVAGNIVIKNNVATMTFEDGDNFKGHFDLVPGVAFTIYAEDGNHLTFNLCEEDLADEVVGMWVCNDAPMEENDDMLIQTFNADGTTLITGMTLIGDILNHQSAYKVIGDLLFIIMPEGYELQCSCSRIQYNANGTTMGDVMTHYSFVVTEDFKVIKDTFTWLRIKQSLDLAGKTYNYHDVFVTNVDGVDKEINILGDSFNFAKMDGSELDIKLKSTLFKVEFPKADTIKYTCRHSSELEVSVEAPIAVEGNKLTIKMSEVYPSCKDVVLYTFQDADNSQMHMYMPTTSFINFFGNMQVTMMAQLGQLDLNDAAAVKAVYDNIDAAVNTINVSLVFKAK